MHSTSSRKQKGNSRLPLQFGLTTQIIKVAIRFILLEQKDVFVCITYIIHHERVIPKDGLRALLQDHRFLDLAKQHCMSQFTPLKH